MNEYINVIGGGLAGSEAAYQIAKRGIKVKLYEMKPKKFTPAHTSNDLAEIVCSNSFKSNLITNACGLLKEELRKLDSLLIRIADEVKVPAGQALAVDREIFAKKVTEEIKKISKAGFFEKTKNVNNYSKVKGDLFIRLLNKKKHEKALENAVYKEVDGILYPLLSVDEAEYNLADIGKYGWMWLRYMEENEPSEYRHMARTGQLRKQAEAVNEEAYERLDNIEAAWLKKHMTGKKKTFMEQLHLLNQARAMAEEIVINEIVFKCR